MHFDENPLLKHLVWALAIKRIRSQSLINRFSIGWTFFPMPPTWKSLWCYFWSDISTPSSIPSQDTFWNSRILFYMKQQESCPSFAGELTSTEPFGMILDTFPSVTNIPDTIQTPSATLSSRNTKIHTCFGRTTKIHTCRYNNLEIQVI